MLWRGEMDERFNSAFDLWTGLWTLWLDALGSDGLR